MKIQTTGLHMVSDGRLRCMIVGGGGVGKSRWASYWPKPIYADCEDGLRSIMDREKPYVSIGGDKAPSVDMLEFLEHLKREGNRPEVQRKYETVVIDTLDSYQRKLREEWMHANKEPAFKGWEAWDFMEQKMQQLMTRLLNLPFNVVVLVHYKDSITGEGDDKKLERVLRISGSSKDWVADDFDLIGRMGFFYEAGKEQGDGRIRKRGLTFNEGDDKWPMLKDRLYMMPDWLEVEFADSDYTNLFSLFNGLVTRHLEAGVKSNDEVTEVAVEVTEEMRSSVSDGPPAPSKTSQVVEDTGGGPMPATVPKGVPFDQLSRPKAIQLCRAVPALRDQVKGNTTKGVAVGLLEDHRKKNPEEWSDDGLWIGDQLPMPEADEGTEAPTAPEATPPEPDDVAADASTPVEEPEPEPEPIPEPEPETEGEETEEEAPAESTESDVASDEPPADDTDGGTSGAETTDRGEGACQVEGCTPDLPGTPANVKRLSKIKFRKYLCGTSEGCFEDCYTQAKDARKVPEGRGWDPDIVEAAS